MKIKTPTTSVNQPKAGFSLAEEIFPDNKLPTSIPAIAMSEIVIRNFQFISWVPIFPVKPTRELIAIIQSEVPIAFLKFKRRMKIRTGTMMNPPPAPTNPVIAPTQIPRIIVKGKPRGLR